jgi:hypothetical protein
MGGRLDVSVGSLTLESVLDRRMTWEWKRSLIQPDGPTGLDLLQLIGGC